MGRSSKVKQPISIGRRTAVASVVLAMAVMAGGAGVASAATGAPHPMARASAEHETAKPDAQDRASIEAERSSHDPTGDYPKDPSTDGPRSDASADSPSVDPAQGLDG